MNDLITITPIHDEPRVLDTDLGKALGMARPNDIRRKVIEPNLDEFQKLGEVYTEWAHNGERGRPTIRYYLRAQPEKS